MRPAGFGVTAGEADLDHLLVDHFVKRYGVHIAVEEANLYPLAEMLLSRADLAAIPATMAQRRENPWARCAGSRLCHCAILAGVGTGAFKVLQFNIQFGQIWDEAHPDNAPVDLDATIAEIRSHEPDIVLLQEVEQGWRGAQLEPPPNYTRLKAALAGYDSFFSYPKADPRELPFGIGLAIFSRTPLTDTFRLNVPSPAIEFDFNGVTTTPTDRLLIGATTALAGRRLRVLNTHLLAFFMLKASSETNLGQRQLVARHAKASTGPTVLGGDFNVSNHRSLVQQFARAGYTAVQAKEITWRRRPYVLDHIFYSRQLKLVRHAVKPTPASDHHALVAELDFTG